jgi:hypothetical protein
VEINTREFLRTRSPAGTFESKPWFGRTADVLTYEPEELLKDEAAGTLQRKKGRDLFDLRKR